MSDHNKCPLCRGSFVEPMGGYCKHPYHRSRDPGCSMHGCTCASPISVVGSGKVEFDFVPRADFDQAIRFLKEMAAKAPCEICGCGMIEVLDTIPEKRFYLHEDDCRLREFLKKWGT